MRGRAGAAAAPHRLRAGAPKCGGGRGREGGKDRSAAERRGSRAGWAPQYRAFWGRSGGGPYGAGRTGRTRAAPAARGMTLVPDGFAPTAAMLGMVAYVAIQRIRSAGASGQLMWEVHANAESTLLARGEGGQAMDALLAVARLATGVSILWSVKWKVRTMLNARIRARCCWRGLWKNSPLTQRHAHARRARRRAGVVYTLTLHTHAS